MAYCGKVFADFILCIYPSLLGFVADPFVFSDLIPPGTAAKPMPWAGDSAIPVQLRARLAHANNAMVPHEWSRQQSLHKMQHGRLLARASNGS